MATCTVQPCDNEVIAKGMCRPHYNRAHHAANSVKAKARTKAWFAANPERVRERNASRDKAAMREAAKRWYRSNRLRAVVSAANQCARKVGAAGRLTVDGVRARLAYFGYRCWICTKPDADSIDHVIPLGAGGPNFNSNIRPAHLGCNAGRSWEGRR